MPHCAITLAIPTYNAGPYIERSLLSALDQDFASPYEVLVIDDGSTDDSMSLVRHLADGHSRGQRIRVVRHAQNRGLGAARNTAIDEADGDYLFFLDADDQLSADCLSHLYALAQKEQADITAGSTLQVEHGETSPCYQLADQTIRHEAAGVWMVANDIFMNIEVWNKLFRLDFLRQHHIRTTHRIMEDSVFDFNVRTFARTIVLSSHATLSYHLHEGSILGSLFGHKATDEAVGTYCDIIRQIQRLIEERCRNIDGIYDLYCLRLFYTFHSLRRMQLSAKQETQVGTSLAGYLDIIPSVRSLRQGAFRMAYVACRLRRNDWRAFEWAYDHRYSRWAYYLKRLLLLY